MNTSVRHALQLNEENRAPILSAATQVRQSSSTDEDETNDDSSFKRKCKQYPRVKAISYFEDGFRVQVPPDADLYTEGMYMSRTNYIMN